MSLLTAAALVVSSFSGLAMNGGVAKAANTNPGTTFTGIAAATSTLTLTTEPSAVATAAVAGGTHGTFDANYTGVKPGDHFEQVFTLDDRLEGTSLSAISSGKIQPSFKFVKSWDDDKTNLTATLKVDAPADAVAGTTETITLTITNVNINGTVASEYSYDVKVTYAATENIATLVFDNSEVTLGGNGKSVAEVTITGVTGDFGKYYEPDPVPTNRYTGTAVVKSGDDKNNLTATATTNSQIHLVVGKPDDNYNVKVTVVTTLKLTQTADGAAAGVAATKNVQATGVITVKVLKDDTTARLELSESGVKTLYSDVKTTYDLSAYVVAPDDSKITDRKVTYSWKTTNSFNYSATTKDKGEEVQRLTFDKVDGDDSRISFYVSDTSASGDAWIWCTATLDGVTTLDPAYLKVTIEPGGDVNAVSSADTIILKNKMDGSESAEVTLTKTNGAKDPIATYLLVKNGGVVNYNNKQKLGTAIPGISGMRVEAVKDKNNVAKITVLSRNAAGVYDLHLIDEFGRVGIVTVMATYEGAIDPTEVKLTTTAVTIDNIGGAATLYATVTPENLDSKGRWTVDSVSIPDVKVIVADETIAEVEDIAPGQGYGTQTDGSIGYGATTSKIVLRGMKKGTTTATVYAYGDETKSATFTISVADEAAPAPTPTEHKAGDVFSADGYTVEVLADLTVAIQDAPVVGKNVTIPEKVDGLTVSAIDEKAFKGSSAKKVYVEGAVAELGKAAFKKSKVKKVFFYQPAALTTVDKNAFAKTNAKVVAVGGSFSKDVAKQLEKAGAKSVKNNGTAK